MGRAVGNYRMLTGWKSQLKELGPRLPENRRSNSCGQIFEELPQEGGTPGHPKR